MYVVDSVRFLCRMQGFFTLSIEGLWTHLNSLHCDAVGWGQNEGQMSC